MFQNYFFLNQIIVVVVLIQCYSININKLNELEYVGAILKKMAIFFKENALRITDFSWKINEVFKKLSALRAPNLDFIWGAMREKMAIFK